jgi:hypothetical protein
MGGIVAARTAEITNALDLLMQKIEGVLILSVCLLR